MDDPGAPKHPPPTLSLDYAAPSKVQRVNLSAWLSITFCAGWFVLIWLRKRYRFDLRIDQTLYWTAIFSLPPLALVTALISRRSPSGGRAIWLPNLALLFFAAQIIVIGMMFPTALHYRDDSSNRMRCGSHLQQVGLAIQLYCNDFNGQFPPNLSTLLVEDLVSSDLFICPQTPDKPALGPTTQAIVHAMRHSPFHCSYLYAGRGLTAKTVTPAHVIAFDKPANHYGAGINVLYGDFHVDFIFASEAAYMLSELNSGHNPPRPATMPTTTPTH